MERELNVCEAEVQSPEGPSGVGTVVAIVAAAFGVRVADIHGTRRGGQDTAFARQVAMYLVHTRLGFSYVASGSLFGRDRTTAAHACRTVEDRREDSRIDGIVDCLERAIDRMPESVRGRPAA
jgi:chromosomal replication initiation ATPase DnaA